MYNIYIRLVADLIYFAYFSMMKFNGSCRLVQVIEQTSSADFLGRIGKVIVFLFTVHILDTATTVSFLCKRN